jgi:phage/plasmid-associated DNA primase
LIKRSDKLTTSEELSGLLNLALVGLKQLKDEGGFHHKDVDDIRKDYEEHTNHVNEFLYRECVVDITNPVYSTLATDLCAAYVAFCVKRVRDQSHLHIINRVGMLARTICGQKRDLASAEV